MRVATSLLALLVASACTIVRGPFAGPAPAHVEGPALTIESAPVELPVHVAYLMPPTGEPQVDRLLASPVLRDPEFREAVDRWIDYWEGPARSWFPEFLRRMGHFEQTVDSALAEKGLPPSLRYLPLIESGYSPGARSGASAVGLWQFMAGTARDHGMDVGAFVDERRNPFMATDAATDYLAALHVRFDSWFLALAGYNGGPNRAQRILRERAPLALPSDSLFWAHREAWPRETQEFVPKLVAAIIVSQNPGRYGYESLVVDPPFRFDEVEVPDAATFDVLAGAAGTDEDEIRRLNPELFRGFTPPGRRWRLRVPPGSRETFEAAFALIPPDQRMTVVEHTVESGETLSHIAVRYGVSVADIQEANPGVRARYLRLGVVLTVPIALGRGEDR